LAAPVRAAATTPDLADRIATPEHADRRATLKLMVFSAQPYAVRYFVNPLRDAGFEAIQSTEARLDRETARISRGYEAVCLFVNDNCDADALKVFAERGVKFIAMRCAGYDRVDVAAAAKLGIKACVMRALCLYCIWLFLFL
jgi:D-lactate dehydrogenase